jgi:hypothetical protein
MIQLTLQNKKRLNKTADLKRELDRLKKTNLSRKKALEKLSESIVKTDTKK